MHKRSNGSKRLQSVNIVASFGFRCSKYLKLLSLVLYILFLFVSSISTENANTIVNRDGAGYYDHYHSLDKDPSYNSYDPYAQAAATALVTQGHSNSGGHGYDQGHGQGMEAAASKQSPYGVPPPVQQQPMSSYGVGTQSQPMVFYYQNMPNPPMMSQPPAAMMSSSSMDKGILSIFMSLLGLLGNASSGLTSMLGLLGLSGLAGLKGVAGLKGLLITLPILLLPILLLLALAAALPLLLLLLIPVPVVTFGGRSLELHQKLDSTKDPNTHRILLNRVEEALNSHQYAFENKIYSNNNISRVIQTKEETSRSAIAISNQSEPPNSLTVLVAKGYAKLLKSLIGSTECVERISCELSRVARNYKQLDSFTNMITNKLSFVSKDLVEKVNGATKSGIKCKRFKCMGWLF